MTHRFLLPTLLVTRRLTLRLPATCAVMLAMAVATAAAPVPASPPAALQLRVLAINDFHGSLRPPGAPARPGQISAGAGALAAKLQQLRAAVPHTVTVSAGDLIGASPLVSALFHDEPTIEVMNRLGLEIEAVGNHDCDAGRTELLRKQHGGCRAGSANSCRGAAAGTPVPFEGARFTFLAANVDDGNPEAPLFPPFVIKRYEGVPVAFIGMTLRGTPEIVSPEGIRGLQFRDEAATVNRLVPVLHRQGVQAIVLVIHQGGAQEDASHNHGGLDGEAPNACAGGLANGTSAPIRTIVQAIEGGVPLVITGHSHQAYNCVLHDRAGQPVRVTQASSYARMLTQIDLQIDRGTGAIVDVAARNLRIDATEAGLTPVGPVEQLVDAYTRLAAPLADRRVGVLGGPVAGGSAPDGSNAAAELIADAQLQATAGAGRGDAQVAFMNGGGVRGAGFVASQYPHALSFGEVFGIQPFGNHLVVMTLSRRDLADLLEQQFAGCQGSTGRRLLHASMGFQQVVDEQATPCHRVRSATLVQGDTRVELIRDGRPVQTDAPVRITVNSFLASGGDGFTVLQRGTDRVGGGQDVDALVAYLQAQTSDDHPLIWTAAERGAPRVLRQP